MQKLFLGLFLFLFIFSAEAQINYTDIYPDIVLDGSDTCFIDIDADGIDDLKFTQEDSASGLNGNGIGVTLLHYDIEFIGDNPSYDPSHFYPFKVDSNHIIDFNADNKQWVLKYGANDVVRVMHIHFFAGADIGEWAVATTNTYLGIRLRIANKWHYGWVRIDVPNNDATMLIIKDYAINMQDNEKIHAGQKQNFGPSVVAASFEDSLCGVVVGFVPRNASSSLLYHTIYKENAGGVFDSIGSVLAGQPSFFLDTDTLISTHQNKYCISALDSIKGTSLLSDTVTLGFLYSDSMLTGEIRLNYQHNMGLEVEPYSLFYRLDSMYQPLPFDSILSTNTSMVDSSAIWINACYNYRAKSILKNPIMISGYGLMDTLKSNTASNYAPQIANPIADFNAVIPLGANFPMTVPFIDESKAAITNWKWSFGDGNYSTSRYPIHTYNNSGTYNVKLTVSNCFGTDSIEKVGFIYVGVASSQADIACQLFPNPSQGIFRITSPANQLIHDITIYDFSGKQILFINQVIQTSKEIDLSAYSQGVYFIEITFEQQKIYKKLILN